MMTEGKFHDHISDIINKTDPTKFTTGKDICELFILPVWIIKYPSKTKKTPHVPIILKSTSGVITYKKKGKQPHLSSPISLKHQVVDVADLPLLL